MLTVLLDDNGTFTDYSIELKNYLSDSADVNLIDGEDSIYIGYYKPIRQIYIELDHSAQHEHTLNFEYYNGSSFTALTIEDYTDKMRRSGFIKWSVPTDIAKTTVNSIELYWYKLYITGHNDNMEIKGISLVFADDTDLKEIEPLVNDFLPSGASSFIGFHQAARNEIIQTMRNAGNYKVGKDSLQREELNVFDLLDPEQLKEAGKYLCLAKIYESLSDRPDDNYQAKFIRYYQNYKDALNLYMKSIDLDDDGIEDAFEKNRLNHGRIILV